MSLEALKKTSLKGLVEIEVEIEVEDEKCATTEGAEVAAGSEVIEEIAEVEVQKVEDEIFLVIAGQETAEKEEMTAREEIVIQEKIR
jgi:hypothetical protein